MSYLHVPGARLYFETHGGGPALLLIPGASGTVSGFALVDRLAAHFTVLIYDRRGFSRSTLDGPQDDKHRLETDADDARRLIEHLSAEPATIFGASSGAIVALEVLTRHPSVVRTLVPFEPPAVRLLPDGQQWVDFFFQVFDVYRQAGMEPALKEFREHAFAVSDRQIMTRARDEKHAEQIRANSVYWFEHELRQYPAVDLDFEALTAHASRVLPAVGRESRGYPCYEVTVALGKRLGREVVELPGGHVGFVNHPAAFARALHESLTSAGRAAPTPAMTADAPVRRR